MILLTGNQRIHPGLSDLLGPVEDLFCRGLRRAEHKQHLQYVAESSTDLMVRHDTQNHSHVKGFLGMNE